MIWLIVAAGAVLCGLFLYLFWRSRRAVDRYAEAAAQVVFRLARERWLTLAEAESLNLLCEVAGRTMLSRRTIRALERHRTRMMNDICQW